MQPYSASALSRAIKTPKIYFRDTGLACYLTRWLTADALKNSAVAGNMFETFIVSEILKSYSNEGDTVLDNCMGSGTTAIACMNTGRNFIGFETDVNYFNIANERIKQRRIQEEQYCLF